MISFASFVFTGLIALHQEAYMVATCRHEKIRVAQQVVVAVHERQGRFLKFEDSLQGWVDVSEKAARTKVCQAFKYRRRQGEQPPAELPGPADS